MLNFIIRKRRVLTLILLIVVLMMVYYDQLTGSQALATAVIGLIVINFMAHRCHRWLSRRKRHLHA